VPEHKVYGIFYDIQGSENASFLLQILLNIIYV